MTRFVDEEEAVDVTSALARLLALSLNTRMLSLGYSILVSKLGHFSTNQ